MITTIQQQVAQKNADYNANLASQGLANTPQETAMNQIMAQLKAGVSNPSQSVPGATGTAPPTIAPPTVTPSTSAGQAFAQAKDASSRISNKALEALRSQMVGRGIEGSGVEGAGTADILSGAQQQQSGAAYDAAKTDEDRAWQAAQLGYQGAITQRGQDVGLTEAGYQNQYYQQAAQNQQLQMLLSLMGTLGGGY
jgi:hypothetical protein